MKNFFNVGWDDTDSAIDVLINPHQFVTQMFESTEEPVQKLITKALFSQLYGNADVFRPPLL